MLKFLYILFYLAQQVNLSFVKFHSVHLSELPILSENHSEISEGHKFLQNISTQLLTVLTTCVILHAEQRKQHISPSGEIFLI